MVETCQAIETPAVLCGGDILYEKKTDCPECGAEMKCLKCNACGQRQIIKICEHSTPEGWP